MDQAPTQAPSHYLPPTGNIYAVDFDGTVVDHQFPLVGPDVPGAVEALRALVAQGHVIILWTMRSGGYLSAAEKWFADRGIPLYGVNENPHQRSWTTSPKAYAMAYIDDAAVGCPLAHPPGFKKACVDWAGVMKMLGRYHAGHVQ